MAEFSETMAGTFRVSKEGMMDITPQEAQEALNQIDDAAHRTQKIVKYALGDVIYITFGIVSIAMCVAIHVLAFELDPPRYGAIGPTCLGLLAVAIGILVWVNLRSAPTRNRAQKRLGWRIAGFWMFLYVYATLWLHFLSPFLRVTREQASEFCVRYGVVSGTIPMFAYVAMGLWLADKVIFCIGLLVTGLIIVALLLLPPHLFYLGMAIAMGGPMIGAGVYCRLRMRQ